MVADFLQAAREQYGFVPDRPRNELEFKRAYAAAALAAGLDKNQVVGIYAFETGGHGAYDTQAGLLVRPSRRARDLAGARLQSVAQHLDHFAARRARQPRGRSAAAEGAQLSGEARQRMARKIAALRRMIAVARSVPHRWSAYDRLAKHTAKGMGMHAVLLDVDIGPLLQVQNLANSLRFARIKGYEGRMSAAELELMNLAGAGNGIDMVMMPQDLARAGADRELLRGRRLLAQPDRAPHQGGGRPDRRDPEPHRPRRKEPRRARAGGGVLGPRPALPPARRRQDQHVEVALRPEVGSAGLEASWRNFSHAVHAEAHQIARRALVHGQMEMADQPGPVGAGLQDIAEPVFADYPAAARRIAAMQGAHGT